MILFFINYIFVIIITIKIMEQLLISIYDLPKELQDLIGEYNIEHIPKMNNVLETFTPFYISNTNYL